MLIRRLAIAATAGAVVSWGLAASVAKWIDLDGVTLAFYRMWFGAAASIILLYMRGGRLTRSTLLLCVPGGLALASDCTLFFGAVKLTTVSNAAVIASLIPVPILLVAPRMFGEKVTVPDILWIGTALLGVALGVYGSSGTPNWNPVGDLMAFGAMLSFAVYFMASKHARRHTGTLEYLAGMMLVGAVGVTPGVIIFGTGISVDNSQVLVGVLMLALLPSLGHLLINWAHPHLELWISSTITSAMPIVAALGALAVFGEPIVMWQGLGMLIVLVAVSRVAMRTGSMELTTARGAGANNRNTQ